MMHRSPTIASWTAAFLAATLAACALHHDARPAPAGGGEAAALAPPSDALPGLFETVALSGLVDPKDWVDMRPLDTPDAILAAWDAAGRPDAGEALAAFVAGHFDPPAAVGVDPELTLAPDRTLVEHIDALWPALTREDRTQAAPGSLLPLAHPYVVPGGRFREVYYWDAYFSLVGVGPENADLVRSMADNFAALLSRYGFIPNANRTYYLSRSQPPFFFMLVSLLDPEEPARAHAAYLDALKAEHAFWMRGADGLSPGEARARVVRMPDGAVLNRYYDARERPRDESYAYDVATAARTERPPRDVYRDLRAAAESGWDFSSRWFGPEGGLASTKTTAIVPVDLNAILFGLERAIAAGCDHQGDRACGDAFRSRAQARAEAVRAHLWRDEDGYFADFDRDAGATRKTLTAAAVYPLFFGLATPAEAARVAAIVERELLATGGLLATSIASGEQWDAPNGWAPLQWLTVEGLARYGLDDQAKEVARRWTATVARGFCESGKLVEKYDVVSAQPGGGGEYPTQDGFGWTNGVTRALIERYEALAALGAITPRPQAPGACAADVAARLSGGHGASVLFSGWSAPGPSMVRPAL